MDLTLEQLHKHAVEHSHENFDILSFKTWLAAKAASQLSGQSCIMDGFIRFKTGPYYSVPASYGQLCEELADETVENEYGEKVTIEDENGCLYKSGKELAELIQQLIENERGENV